MTSAEEFVAFAEAAAPQLRRTAFLLCGNWHTAEDLAQTALAKVFVSWRKIRRRDAAHAYATRTLVNCYLADRRLKRAASLIKRGDANQALVSIGQHGPDQWSCNGINAGDPSTGRRSSQQVADR